MVLDYGPDAALLARYRRDYEASKRGGGAGGGGGIGWLQLQDGVNVVRILPPYGEGDQYSIVVGQHFGLGSERRAGVFCPRLTLGFDGRTPLVDWSCPVCEYTDLVRGSARRGRELSRARDLGAVTRWVCQVLDRDGDDVDAPLLWSFGLPVYGQLLGFLTGTYPDLLDADEGQDIAVRKVRQDRSTTYTLSPEGKPSPVSDAALERLVDLKSYIKSRIPRPEELGRVLDGRGEGEASAGP